jgi:hypothetical protein
MMRKYIGLSLMFAALVLIGVGLYRHYHVGYWMKPPAEKFLISWSEDVQLLEKTQKLPKEWKEIKEISIKGDNSPVQDWIQKIKPPITKKASGRYRLEIFIIHWIEGYRYGTVVQYDLVDLVTNNTVWEISRTYKLGIVY